MSYFDTIGFRRDFAQLLAALNRLAEAVEALAPDERGEVDAKPWTASEVDQT